MARPREGKKSIEEKRKIKKNQELNAVCNEILWLDQSQPYYTERSGVMYVMSSLTEELSCDFASRKLQDGIFK